MVFQEIALDHWRGSRGAETSHQFMWNTAIDNFRGDNQQLMILDILFFACCRVPLFWKSPKRLRHHATSLPGQPFQVESWDGFESHVLFGLGTHWPERSGTHRVFAERFGGGCVEPQTDDKGRHSLTVGAQKWWKNPHTNSLGFLKNHEKGWVPYIDDSPCFLHLCIKDVFFGWTLRGESVWSKRG